MKDGNIVEMGTYNELLSAKGAFYTLIKEYGKRKDEELVSTDSGVKSSENLDIPASPSKEDIPEVKSAEKSNQDVSKIISTEGSARGSVSFSVYKEYAASCGYPNVLIFLLISTLSQASQVMQNVFLSSWANANDLGEATDSKLWLSGYAAIGIFSSLFVVVQVVFVWIYCGIRSARVLHSNLLENIMQLPQSFFDTTPLGRIMNRFSKDQYTVDEVLPRSFQMYFRTLFSCISVLAINAVSAPYYILFAVPLGIFNNLHSFPL